MKTHHHGMLVFPPPYGWSAKNMAYGDEHCPLFDSEEFAQPAVVISGKAWIGGKEHRVTPIGELEENEVGNYSCLAVAEEL